MPASPQISPPETAPSLPLMHAAFVLAGLGTMLLGPILPLLSLRWQLSDAHTGLLLTAQFVGATAGGASVPPRLRRGLVTGLAAAAFGFLAFAWAPGLPWACAALAAGGFGVGRVIASVNITAGNRYTQHRATALTWLNFSWSFGALLSPLLAAALAPRFALPYLLTGFAACFLLVGTWFAVQLRHCPAETHEPAAPRINEPAFANSTFLYFAAMLMVYGGLETCLSGWLTTYALRDGKGSLLLSQYTMVLLLCGLTGGRALAAWLLHHLRDSTLQRLALLLSAGLAAGLAMAHRAATIASLAVLLGIALAPVFPATFAIFLGYNPPTRKAGMVLAASGIGAAAFPAWMGLVSTRTGSLRTALAVPAGVALLMFLMSLREGRAPRQKATISDAPVGV